MSLLGRLKCGSSQLVLLFSARAHVWGARLLLALCVSVQPESLSVLCDARGGQGLGHSLPASLPPPGPCRSTCTHTCIPSCQEQLGIRARSVCCGECSLGQEGAFSQEHGPARMAHRTPKYSLHGHQQTQCLLPIPPPGERTGVPVNRRCSQECRGFVLRPLAGAVMCSHVGIHLNSRWSCAVPFFQCI